MINAVKEGPGSPEPDIRLYNDIIYYSFLDKKIHIFEMTFVCPLLTQSPSKWW